VFHPSISPSRLDFEIFEKYSTLVSTRETVMDMDHMETREMVMDMDMATVRLTTLVLAMELDVEKLRVTIVLLLVELVDIVHKTMLGTMQVPNIKRVLTMALVMSRVLATMVYLMVQALGLDLDLSGMDLMVDMGNSLVQSLSLFSVRGS
jgi:hypothetical protein